jgi:hypothetical protein
VAAWATLQPSRPMSCRSRFPRKRACVVGCGQMFVVRQRTARRVPSWPGERGPHMAGEVSVAGRCSDELAGHRWPPGYRGGLAATRPDGSVAPAG